MFDLVALLFVIASMLGFINYKVFRLPATIGVMVGALIASLLMLLVEALMPSAAFVMELRGFVRQIDFAYALMHGMLGFLLFAGALHVDLGRLREHIAPILSLASVGVLLSTGLVGVGTWAVFNAIGQPIPFIYCLLFGALISPTDPVAVVGIMRSAGAPPDVETKVVGESLFNDGVGVIVFGVLLGMAGGGGHGTVDPLPMLILKEVGGGIAIGLLGGLLAFWALKQMEEPNLETFISVALVMGITSASFAVHASAPLACVIAGLFIGNRGRMFAMGDATRARLDTIWAFIDEALNIALFLLIGLEAMILTFSVNLVGIALLLAVLVLAARTVGVALPMIAFKDRLRAGTRTILVWGGLRGGISIALALSLPQFEGRDTILTITYIVVVLSVLLQGLTIGMLIERLIPDGEKIADTH